MTAPAGEAPTTRSRELAELLARWNRGEHEVAADMLPLVYDELRAIARRHFRRERGYRTLQPTAAVHEAFVRFSGAAGLEVRDRRHLVALLARLMRQVLVDAARVRGAARHGGGAVRVAESELGGAPGVPGAEILDLEAALARLEEMDPRKARILELRLYGGLTVEEIAASLETSTATVNREWRKARAWLLHELGHDG